MNLKQLKEIKSELKRFQERVEEAIKLAESVEGWKGYGTEDVYGKHDISGTRMSGAVKRGAQELKYFLTKKI